MKDSVEFVSAVANVDVQHWLVLLLMSWITTSLSLWNSLDLLAILGIGKREPSALNRILPLPDAAVFRRMPVTPSDVSRNAEYCNTSGVLRLQLRPPSTVSDRMRNRDPARLS